jgi:hypothetical protein
MWGQWRGQSSLGLVVIGLAHWNHHVLWGIEYCRRWRSSIWKKFIHLTPKGPETIFKPFLKFGQAIVKAIFIKNSWIKLWACGLVLASRCTKFYKIPIFGLVLMSQNTFFFSIRVAKKLFIFLSFVSWNFFHWFSTKFLNIYLADPNSRKYTFYVINCKRFYKL